LSPREIEVRLRVAKGIQLARQDYRARRLIDGCPK
jgi:hypothetical protein